MIQWDLAMESPESIRLKQENGDSMEFEREKRVK